MTSERKRKESDAFDECACGNKKKGGDTANRLLLRDDVERMLAEAAANRLAGADDGNPVSDA